MGIDFDAWQKGPFVAESPWEDSQSFLEEAGALPFRSLAMASFDSI